MTTDIKTEATNDTSVYNNCWYNSRGFSTFTTEVMTHFASVYTATMWQCWYLCVCVCLCACLLKCVTLANCPVPAFDHLLTRDEVWPRNDTCLCCPGNVITPDWPLHQSPWPLADLSSGPIAQHVCMCATDDHWDVCVCVCGTQKYTKCMKKKWWQRFKKIQIVDVILTLIVMGMTEGQKSVEWRVKRGGWRKWESTGQRSHKSLYLTDQLAFVRAHV